MNINTTLAALSAFGTQRRKPSRRTSKTGRERLQAVIQDQLKRLDLTDPTSTWLTKLASGAIVICARNGVVPLCIGGDQNYAIECPDTTAAKGYLTALLDATRAGALDELLAATARGQKRTAG